MKALFLILCLFLGPDAQAQTPVEIYANGHKYDSLQAYKTSEKPVAGNSSKAQSLSITADFLSAATMHELYGLGVEEGVMGALNDFYQASLIGLDSVHEHTIVLGATVGQTIAADQIEEVIRKAVSASNSPKLLISESGKFRIMSLDTDEAQK